jgi:hypothetical protein
MYAFFLYKNRVEIMHRKQNKQTGGWFVPIQYASLSADVSAGSEGSDDDGKIELSEEVKHLSFLWEAYESKYW